MARIETDLVIDAGRASISLGGSLDTSNAHRLGALLRRLIHEGCREIEIDMGAVRNVDPAAIGILRGAANSLRRAGGGGLCFTHPSSDVAGVLARSGLLAPERVERVEVVDVVEQVDIRDDVMTANATTTAITTPRRGDDRAVSPSLRSPAWRERRAPTRQKQ